MELTDTTGSFGPWQKRVFWVFFMVNTVGIWQNLSITFLAPNMDFICINPLPAEIRSNSSWLRNNRSLLQTSKFASLNEMDQCVVNGTKCTEWEFDTSQFSDTIVSEWDLVCDREWLVSLAKSVYMIGFLLSVFFFGQLSDIFGRLPIIIVSYIVTVISMFLALLSKSYTTFVVLRFFQAFGRTGLTTTGFVLITELVGPQHRTDVGITIQFGWGLGFVTLAGVGWLFRNWFWLQLAMSIPIVPIALGYWFIPESPRWLLMNGKLEKLENLLKKAAKLNGKEMKLGMRDLELYHIELQKEESNRGKKTVLDLFRTPILRKRMLCMLYLWIVNAFMYYALSFNTNDWAGDSYLNFFIAGLLEFPAYVLLLVAIKKWGRRPTLLWLMMVAGAASLALIPVPLTIPWLRTALPMLGKFCISGSFGLLYLYTSEMFPTVVRNTAIGSCSMCARIGSIVAPFVKELGAATHRSVPDGIYGLLAITSGLLALLLPETRGRQIPDTIEEGERFGGSNGEEKAANNTNAETKA